MSPRIQNWKTAAFLRGLLLPRALIACASADESERPAAQVELRLELSHDKFDPKHPAGTIARFATNISNGPPRLPVEPK